MDEQFDSAEETPSPPKTRIVTNTNPELAQAILTISTTQQQHYQLLLQLAEKVSAIQLAANTLPPDSNTLPSIPVLNAANLNVLQQASALPQWVYGILEVLSRYLAHPSDPAASAVMADDLWKLVHHAANFPEPANTPYSGKPRSPRPFNRTYSPASRGRKIQFEGKTLYVSKSGRTFDISKPPPYPCRSCHKLHWIWENCQNE